MSAKILWVDEDFFLIEKQISKLRREGYEVHCCKTAFDGESELLLEKFDLVIIDAMIPILDNERLVYTSEETNGGLQTGVVFYRRMKTRLQEINAKTLVLTLRRDQEIVDAFVNEGLPESAVLRKDDFRDMKDFVYRVKHSLKS
jgi:DNA-binding response OmpR family regulator